MTKYAHIPSIDGVVFSDPCYDSTVWCQYRKDFQDSNWYMKLDSSREDDLIFFQMHLGRNTMCADTNVTFEEDTYRIAYPKRYDVDHAELGMDTARMFCGSKENWDEFSEEAAIHTGSDGIFGNLFIFTCIGEQNPAGFILTGAVDSLFAREVDLFATFVSSFEGTEISKEQFDKAVDRKNLSYKMLASKENMTANQATKENHQSLDRDSKESER